MRLLRFDNVPIHTYAIVCTTIALALVLTGCSRAPGSAKSPDGSASATSSAGESSSASSPQPYPGPSAPSGMYTAQSGRTVVVGVLEVQDVEVNGVATVMAKMVGETSAANGPTRPLVRLDVPDASMESARKLNGTRVAVEGALSEAAVVGQTPFLTLETITPAPAP